MTLASASAPSTAKPSAMTVRVDRGARPWLVLSAAVLVMTGLGVGYGWSLFVPALITRFGWTHQQAQTVFGALIAVYSITMIGAGPLVARWRPQTLTLISALLFSLGLTLAAISRAAFWPTLLGVGVIAGMGVGFGYVTALSTAIAWFPKRKGAASGLAAAGFGGAPMLMTLALEPLLASGLEVYQAFSLLALVNGSALTLGALALSQAPRTNPSTGPAASPERAPLRQTLAQAAFWSLFIAMLADTFAGFLLIGAMKPLGLAFGLSVQTAASGVLFLALGNCSGRFVWGLIADRIGARAVPLSLACLALAPLTLLASQHAPAYFAGAALTGFCFGSAFSIHPSQIAARFGMAHVATLYPLVLIAQAMSALAGPPIGGWIIDQFHHYQWLIALASAAAAAGAFAVWRLDASVRLAQRRPGI